MTPAETWLLVLAVLAAPGGFAVGYLWGWNAHARTPALRIGDRMQLMEKIVEVQGIEATGRHGSKELHMRTIEDGTRVASPWRMRT